MKSDINDFVFIVGAPRSGTYLLLAKLSQQFDIAFPVETHFIPIFKRYLWLWGDLSVESNRRSLLRSIYEFLELWTFRSERGRDVQQIRQVSLLSTREDFDLIVSQSCSYEEIVVGLFESFALGQSKTMWGDKSAFYAHVPLESLAASVTRLKVVHIVRDGRDVGMSWRKIFTGPETLTEAAIRWSEHVLNKREWGRNNPESYLEVSYENLIEDELGVVSQIADFLGVSKVAVDGVDMGAILSQGDMHSKISAPICKKNKDKWRKEMSSEDVAVFEGFAGNALKSSGYRVSGEVRGLRFKVGLGVCRLANVFVRAVSSRYWRVVVKNSLPPLLWLCDKTGFPVSGLLNRKYR